MKRLVIAGLLAAAVTASGPASAGDRLSPGGAAALGVLGGVALGAAIASTQPPPPPPPVYVERAPKRVYVERPARRVYVEEQPVEECFTQRERVWVPGYGWEVRRRTVCE